MLLAAPSAVGGVVGRQALVRLILDFEPGQILGLHKNEVLGQLLTSHGRHAVAISSLPPGVTMPRSHPVEHLFARLAEIRPYGGGLVEINSHLPGLGFFPGGDGPGKAPGSRLRPPMPVGGIRVLGNNFQCTANHPGLLGTVTIACILHPSFRGPNLRRRSFGGLTGAAAEETLVRKALRCSEIPAPPVGPDHG